METEFNNSSLNLETLREFCKREGEVVKYNKGDQMEREGDPTRWFAFVEYGCFKYLTYGISDDKEHVVWFSFKDEFVGDYPACLSGLPAQITIKATMPSRVIRVTSEQLNQFFDQNIETMELRSLIAEHMTSHIIKTYTAPRHSSVTNFCYSVVPASYRILQCRISLRTSISRLLTSANCVKNHSQSPYRT